MVYSPSFLCLYFAIGIGLPVVGLLPLSVVDLPLSLGSSLEFAPRILVLWTSQISQCHPPQWSRYHRTLHVELRLLLTSSLVGMLHASVQG